MALLDEGETDWKVIVVDVQDSLASKLNDIEDVERNLPGLIRATNEWFRCVFLVIIAFRACGLIYGTQDLQDPRRQARERVRFLGRGQKQKIRD
jgi:hypothetical protein